MKHALWIATLLAAGSLTAHHALTNYDTTTAVRVKGTILAFAGINPHTMLFIEGAGPDGQTRRWAVEGPAMLQLQRRNFKTDALKPGAPVEVCGYLPKEPIVWQLATKEQGAISQSGRLLNGEMMIFPDGTQQTWGDYGVHKCFAPGFTDQHVSK